MIQDFEQNQDCSTQDLANFCVENKFIGWFNTSAKTGLNIEKGMDLLIQEILKNKKKFKPNKKNKNSIVLDPSVLEKNDMDNAFMDFYETNDCCAT